MIRLTNDHVLIADERQYIMGKLKNNAGERTEVRNPRYYTSVAQAVRGALEFTMRTAVADGSVTTLREFIQKQEALRDELQKLLAPLE